MSLTIPGGNLLQVLEDPFCKDTVSVTTAFVWVWRYAIRWVWYAHIIGEGAYKYPLNQPWWRGRTSAYAPAPSRGVSLT